MPVLTQPASYKYPFRRVGLLPPIPKRCLPLNRKPVRDRARETNARLSGLWHAWTGTISPFSPSGSIYNLPKPSFLLIILVFPSSESISGDRGAQFCTCSLPFGSPSSSFWILRPLLHLSIAMEISRFTRLLAVLGTRPAGGAVRRRCDALPEAVSEIRKTSARGWGFSSIEASSVSFWSLGFWLRSDPVDVYCLFLDLALPSMLGVKTPVRPLL